MTRREDRLRCDVVIVGGGTAGCALAGRLSERQELSVVVLEAGPDVGTVSPIPRALEYVQAPLPPRFLWEFDGRLRNQSPAPSQQVRGRTLGGSSAVNGAIFLRGLGFEYDSWNQRAWSYRALLPYFTRMEADRDFNDDYHGSTGPIPVCRIPMSDWNRLSESFGEAVGELGFKEKPDLNAPGGEGFGPLPLTCGLNGKRTSTATAYIEPARNRSNLTVLDEAVVQRVIFEGRRAVGVIAIRRGSEVLVNADEVVLSAGAYGSPEILMNSGVGPADKFRGVGQAVVSDVPGVGQNLRCHPGVRAKYMSVDEGRGGGEGIAHQVALLFSSKRSGAAADLMMIPRQVGDTLAVHLTVRDPLSQGHLEFPWGGHWRTPVLHYNYLDDGDLDRLVDGALQLLEIFDSPSLAWATDASEGSGVASARSRQALGEWITRELYTPYHACGTCKMGDLDEDPTAVVGPDLRVRGVEGLLVADASILPRSVRGGPYAPSIMIGERTADLVAMGRTSGPSR
jgi:choline dehydrogenase